MKRLCTLLAFALLAVGCASVPMAPPEVDLAAKQFKPTPGKANVYVFRDESIGAAVKMPILLDGRLLGDTAARTFLLTAVDPGPHQLLSKTENDSVFAFTAVPGSNLFVWQEVKMGVWSARSKLQQVDDAAGKARVMACKLAVGAQPPPPPPPAQPAPVPGA
jgi:hypothetical protein